MKIAFRTDASREIGTGHVMRCLTLAEALRGQGAECHFISRAFDPRLMALISDRGFSLWSLPVPGGPAPKPPPSHAAWAGVDWQVDATETGPLLQRISPDWLILDHYAFDHRWQRAACPKGTRLLVIDDLADRSHICDILLDQNLGRTAWDYADLVPNDAVKLIGPDFALLRPEFAGLRAEAIAARASRRLQRVLVSMGGVDAGDATSVVLRSLEATALPENLMVTVVMGRRAPALERVRKLVKTISFKAELVVDVSDMGQRMAEADLAIGAGGATAWERCALGLPTLIIPIAANQLEATAALEQSGAALTVDDPDAADFTDRFVEAFEAAHQSLDRIGSKAAQLCDGDGAGRVLPYLLAGKTAVREATLEDSRRVWEWRAASDLKRFSRSGKAPDYPDHHAWFRKALQDPTMHFRIMLKSGRPCGYFRLDLLDHQTARVSLCLAPDERGKGLASQVLTAVDQLAFGLRLSTLVAEIHPDNAASISTFRRAGYILHSAKDGFQTYAKTLCEDA